MCVCWRPIGFEKLGAGRCTAGEQLSSVFCCFLSPCFFCFLFFLTCFRVSNACFVLILQQLNTDDVRRQRFFFSPSVMLVLLSRGPGVIHPSILLPPVRLTLAAVSLLATATAVQVASRCLEGPIRHQPAFCNSYTTMALFMKYDAPVPLSLRPSSNPVSLLGE